MKTFHPARFLSVACALLLFSACKKAPDPAHTLTVAIDAGVIATIEPLLKVPDAVKGYNVVVLGGPPKALHRRIVQEGFSPDVLITTDLTNMMVTVFPDYVSEPIPFAQIESTQAVALLLKGSLKADAFRMLMDLLQGSEGAAKLKQAGYIPIPNPLRVDPNDVVYGKDGEVKIPIIPGTPVGQSHGSR